MHQSLKARRNTTTERTATQLSAGVTRTGGAGFPRSVRVPASASLASRQSRESGRGPAQTRFPCNDGIFIRGLADAHKGTSQCSQGSMEATSDSAGLEILRSAGVPTGVLSHSDRELRG